MVFLSKLAGLLKDNDPEFVLLELDRAYHLYTGYDARFMMSLSCEDLVRLIGDRPELVFIAGLIMKEQAMLLNKQGNEGKLQSVSLLKKSICLRESVSNQKLPEQLLEKSDLSNDNILLRNWQN